MSDEKVYIIPCSGIGKVFGSMCREAAYIVVDELAKDKAVLECLPLIVKGKQEVIDALKANKIITIDGCPLKCSYNDVTFAVREPDAVFMSTQMVRENPDIKIGKDIMILDENAKILSRKLAEKIAEKVEELVE
jgi:uncharacterized metal-binding protein